MKKKTALQQAIEKFEKGKSQLNIHLAGELKQFLHAEREQIEEAFNEGAATAADNGGNIYFTETYEQ